MARAFHLEARAVWNMDLADFWPAWEDTIETPPVDERFHGFAGGFGKKRR
ncbi:MAG TPA: hypothetical protein PLY73_00940 [Candidatus Ozemobacteraceae bacterium]|nr:hypothetical protein [Candidatus Ozemobacteraceae bacterium]